MRGGVVGAGVVTAGGAGCGAALTGVLTASGTPLRPGMPPVPSGVPPGNPPTRSAACAPSGGAGRTADSWAAAATWAFPMTRIVGSPSSQAAAATSVRACA